MTEIVTQLTPPLLQGPSDKEKKYDRQLRLWAASGQAALEGAHILLVNSGSGTVGVETLKNLVLPGIGKFTIADDALVTEADLGGEPQESLFAEQKYTLILYSLPIDQKTLALIQDYGRQHKIPQVAIHSVGFYSYFHIQIPGVFPIVDTHPDPTSTTDLRLLTPWPELSNFATELTKDINNLSAHEHGHIPYLVLLLYYLKIWKKEHGTFPSNFKEKKAFAKMISAEARTNNPEGGEENYDEAAAAVNRSIVLPSLRDEVKEVFAYIPNDEEAKSSFWVIASAVKEFYEKNKALPLPGSVPDMKAQSSVYVQLQNIYKAKARQDIAEVLEIVRAHPQGKDIEATQVETFCKNAASITLIRGSNSGQDSAHMQVLASKTFSSMYGSLLIQVQEKERENDKMAPLTSMPLSLLPIYLSLSAISHVSTASSKDILATIDRTVPDASLDPHQVQITEEVARAKGGELHNISALTGGMVAQEVIKIITEQYIPIDNTCIFDGVSSHTQVLRI
ncbi:hypothetical protein B7494_g6239 [Chlorociboria aeruginascens]|nr:hypothetical protein B7494_g6239 [Chlorociboria aeruginascens]